jgi:hypothetical protein
MAANTTTKVTPAETRVVFHLADSDSGSDGVRSFSITFVSNDWTDFPINQYTNAPIVWRFVYRGKSNSQADCISSSCEVFRQTIGRRSNLPKSRLPPMRQSWSETKCNDAILSGQYFEH